MEYAKLFRNYISKFNENFMICDLRNLDIFYVFEWIWLRKIYIVKRFVSSASWNIYKLLISYDSWFPSTNINNCLKSGWKLHVVKRIFV